MSQNVQPIRLGIIGTGLAVEKLHWPALTRMPDRFQVTAFANHSRPKAEHFAEYSDTSMDRFSEDYHDLLARDDVDAVLISLPIPLSYTVTSEALAAGKHVICEKPAGADEVEARAFVQLTRRYPNQVILVAENWFYRDDLRFARSLLDSGVIGTINLVSWKVASQLIPREGEFSSTPWRHRIQYDGGIHLDGGVHHTAELRMLVGDVNRLHGEIQDANSTHDGPSILNLSFRLVNGAIGTYTASYPEIPVANESNDLYIYGTAGKLTVGRSSIRVDRADGSWDDYRVQTKDGGYYNEFLDFHDAISLGIRPVGTVTQSFRNMELILRGIESARKGQVISLSELPEQLSAKPVPLWKPYGQDDLFAGLDVAIEHSHS